MNKKIILLAFGISGMTALIYEIVWTRPLQLIFGSTIHAFSTILTTFFIGFALGAFMIRNFADKTSKPLFIFAILQLGIGVYGLLILWMFKMLMPVYLSLYTAGLQFMQFFLIFLVLIFPATLFGASWPIACKAYVGKEKQGCDIGIIYSANSLGSFSGPLFAGFFLIPFLGIKSAALFTASLNLLVAFTFFYLIIFEIKKGEKNETNSY